MESSSLIIVIVLIFYSKFLQKLDVPPIIFLYTLISNKINKIKNGEIKMKKIEKIIGIGIATLLLLLAWHPFMMYIVNADFRSSENEHDTDLSESGNPCPCPDCDEDDPLKPEKEDSDNDDDINAVGISISPNGNNQPAGEIPYDGGVRLGPALHIELTTGNIFTKYEVCSGLTIHYNSLNANIHTSLGFGWTHSSNIYLDDSPSDGVVIVDGKGLISKYLDDGSGGFIRPPTRRANLSYEEDHYILRFFDGSKIEFRNNAAPDGFYYIKKYITQHGQIYTYNYNANGKLKKIKTGNTKSLSFRYYSDGKLQWIEHVNYKKTSFTYNEEEELICIKDPYGKEMEYYYDEQHQITFEKLKNDIYYTASYIDETERFLNDSEGNVIFHIVSPDGFPTQRPVACIPGDVTMTDGNGKRWIISRNAYGQKTKIETQDGYFQEFEYYESGVGERMLKRIRNYRGFNIFYIYDEFDNVRYFIDQEGKIIEYQYNDMRFPGLMTELIRDDLMWSYRYNEQARLQEEIDPTDNSTNYSYIYWPSDPPNRIRQMNETDRNGHVTIWNYDKYERLTSRIKTLDSGEELREVYVYFNNYYQCGSVTHCDDNDPDHCWEEPIYCCCGRTKQVRVHRGSEDLLVTNYVYDLIGRLIRKVVDPDEMHLVDEYMYDDMGNMLTWENPRNVVTYFVYDHRERLINVIEDEGGPNEIMTAFEYDGNDNVVNITDPMGYKTQLFYDNQSQLIQEIDPEGYVTNYDLDANGNVITFSRALRIDSDPQSEDEWFKVGFVYDKLDRVNKTILDPNGQALTTEIEYVDGLGGCGCGGTAQDLIRKIVDAEGKITFAEYDHLERLTTLIQKVQDNSEEIDDDDVITRFIYDAEGNVVSAEGPEGEIVNYTYDAADRLVKQIADPQGINLVWEYGYDGACNLNKSVMPNGNVIEATYDKANRLESIFDGVSILYLLGYDENGNIVSVSDALGRTWTARYDSLDRMTMVFDPKHPDIPGQTIHDEYEYDDNSQLIKHKDRNNVATKYMYNALGWMNQTIQDFEGEDPITANTKTTAFYNGLGQVEWLLDHYDHPTRYIYDSVGNLREIRYADDLDGTGDDHITFEYDNVGNLRIRTDQNEDRIEFTYDDLHRMNKTIYPAKGEQPGYSDIYLFDRSSRLIEATNPFASWEFDYDALGRLIGHNQSNTDLAGGRWYRTQFDYDVANPESTVTITYPDGRQIVSILDLRFRVTEIVSAGVSVDWFFNEADELRQVELGNGFLSEFVYDSLGRLTYLNHTFDEILHYSDEYGYDSVGNRVFTRKNHDPINSERYEYDTLNRLVRFERGVLNQEGTAIETFTSSEFLKQWQEWALDRVGNWLQTTIMKDGMQEPFVEGRNVNDVNEYTNVGGVSFEGKYDNNGNLLNDSKYNYNYDAANRLIKIINQSTQDEISFTYDALGRKVTSTRNGVTTHHLYSGLTEIQERRDDGTFLREYIPGVTGLLAIVDYTGATPETFYYLHDGLGSVVALTDDTGELVERYAYEPYGETFVTDESGALIDDGKELLIHWD